MTGKDPDQQADRDSNSRPVTTDLQEELERGQVLEVSYSTEEPGEQRLSITGTVCKSNRGGIRVLSSSGRTLFVVKTGTVTKTHPDGGSLRHRSKVGTAPRVEVREEFRAVEYQQRGGWTYTEEEQ